MSKKLFLAALALMAVALPTWARGGTGVPLLDNPQGALTDEADSRLAASMASSKLVGRTFDSVVKDPSDPTRSILPFGRGWTVENRPLDSDVRQALGFDQIALKYPLTALRLQQEQEQLRLRLIAGIGSGQTSVGLHGVYDAEWVRRVTDQRTDQRANAEVNQGSMPPKGSIQMSAVTGEYSYTLTGYKTGQEWGYELFKATFLLSVVFRDTASGQVIASFTNAVERTIAVRGVTGNEYSQPVLPAALDLNLAVFAAQLREAVAASDAYVAANHARVPFRFTNGYAWLTLGRRDGLVGSNDGARVPGSRVKITGASGLSFTGTAFQTGETTALMSVENLTTSDLELLGQNPTAEIVRERQAAAPTQPAPPAPVPSAAPLPAPEKDVPTIGASPTREPIPTPTVPETAADLIRAKYGTVTVETANDALPAPPEGVRWLRVTNPQASTWTPGTVVLAVRFAPDGTEATRFQSVVVTAAAGKALVWMPATASVSGEGEWVTGTYEPLCLTLDAASAGSVIVVPDDVKVEGAAPARMRWVNVPNNWFGATRPVRGLVLTLRREAEGQPPVEVKALVIAEIGNTVRCAYGLPEQAFDRSWKAVLTPSTETVPVPVPVPDTTIKPAVDMPAFDPDTDIGRFLNAANLTAFGKVVPARVPSFRDVTEIRENRPEGVGLSIIPVPGADRQKVGPGLKVRAVRVVDGRREEIPAVIMAHMADAANPGRAYLYVWTLSIPSGNGWRLELPGVTPPVQ